MGDNNCQQLQLYWNISLQRSTNGSMSMEIKVLWVFLPMLQTLWEISCLPSYLYQEPPSLPGRSAGCWSLSRLPPTSSVQSLELSQRRTRLWRMAQTSSTTVHWQKVGCSNVTSATLMMLKV